MDGLLKGISVLGRVFMTGNFFEKKKTFQIFLLNKRHTRSLYTSGEPPPPFFFPLVSFRLNAEMQMSRKKYF
jgi:hypothetical protein